MDSAENCKRLANDLFSRSIEIALATVGMPLASSATMSWCLGGLQATLYDSHLERATLGCTLDRTLQKALFSDFGCVYDHLKMRLGPFERTYASEPRTRALTRQFLFDLQACPDAAQLSRFLEAWVLNTHKQRQDRLPMVTLICALATLNGSCPTPAATARDADAQGGTVELLKVLACTQAHLNSAEKVSYAKLMRAHPEAAVRLLEKQKIAARVVPNTAPLPVLQSLRHLTGLNALRSVEIAL